MRRSGFGMVLAGVLLGLGVSPLLAQSQGINVGAHVGYTFGGDIEKNNIAVGVQGSYQFSQVRFELGYDRLKDETENGDMTLDADAITVSAWYCVPMQDRGSIYLGGGLGYYLADADVDGLDIDPALGFHIGGGASFPVSDNMAIFLDLRYTMVKFDFEYTEEDVYYRNGYTTYSTYIYSGESDWNHMMARAGINFSF